jgi:hypothetical protein
MAKTARPEYEAMRMAFVWCLMALDGEDCYAVEPVRNAALAFGISADEIPAAVEQFHEIMCGCQLAPKE